MLPSLVLAAGLLVAALSALSVRYILISRLKSAHLAKSLALNAGIISSSAHLVIAVDDQYRRPVQPRRRAGARLPGRANWWGNGQSEFSWTWPRSRSAPARSSASSAS